MPVSVALAARRLKSDMRWNANKKQIKLLRQLLVGAVLAVAFLFSYSTIVETLHENPAGYCAAQKRYISDDEYVRAAIALHEWEWNRKTKIYPSGEVTSWRERNESKYRVWEHSRNSSECCSVYRGEAESVLNRLFGRQKIEVTLFVDLENKGDAQSPFLFDVCGKVLAHEFGYRPERSVDITTSNYRKFAQ